MKKNKLNLSATLMIILGLFIIIFAVAFVYVDPNQTVAQINSILN